MVWLEVTPQTSGWRYMKITAKNSFANVRTSPFVTTASKVGTITKTQIEGKINSEQSYDDGTYIWFPVSLSTFPEHPILWVASSSVLIEFGELVNEPVFWDIDFTGTMPIYVTPAEKDEAVKYLRALTQLSKDMPATALTKVPIILEAYTDYLDTLRKT